MREHSRNLTRSVGAEIKADDALIYRANSPIYIYYYNAKLANPLALQEKGFKSFDVDNLEEVEEATFDLETTKDGFIADIEYKNSTML